jgi:hypothetical protein
MARHDCCTDLFYCCLYLQSQLIHTCTRKCYVVWKIQFIVAAVTAVRRHRTVLLQIWSGKIGYGIWYENYTAVKGKCLWLLSTIVKYL